MRAPSASGRPHISNYASPDKTLSEEHRHQLENESAIAPDVIAKRGYRTISSCAELLEFKRYQRRAPALYIPMYSPCGRILPQIKANTPRKDKHGDPIRYETPGGSEPVIDVHPRNHTALKDTARRLWITEGVKKGDALTTAGEVAISLAGVWMFGTKDGLYPAWDYVALERRDVIFAYDSDIMRKPSVAAALERGARLLEERGATVYIVYLDDGPNGEKVGVDDYLAGQPAGTVAEMVAKAVPYDPANFEYLRIERNLALKDALAHLWRVHAELPTRTQGENTRRSVMRALIHRAARYGRVVKDGVSVSAPTRSVAIEARVGHKTAARALRALSKAEILRLEREAAGKKAAHYVLLLPDPRVSDTLGGEGAQGRESSSKRQPNNVSPTGGLPLYVSLARASENPAFCRTCDPCVSLTREGVRPIPELRWSAPSRRPTRKEIHAARTCASQVPLPRVREAIARLGKKRAGIIEHILLAGGSCEVDDLMARFAGEETRRRDFVRRQLLPMTDPVIIEIDEGTVALTKDWEVALEKARELGGENRANEEQIEKVKRQREAYHAGIQPDEIPEMVVGDELCQPWPLHPDGCACRECSERFGRVIGEHVEDCRCAKCYAARKEADRGRVARVDKDRRRPRRRRHQRTPSWRHPQAQKSTPDQEAPAMVSMHPQANSPAEDRRSHPLDCECDHCLYPEPKYARPYPGSG